MSGAATVGDVAADIEANPPAGRTVTVSITPTGLNVSLDSAGGGNLSIGEVDGGTTAASLGILDTNLVGTGPLVGTALNPTLTTTTPLNNLLGAPAQAVVNSAAADSSFLVQANANGTAGNGYAVQFIDDGKVTAGNETVNVDSANKTITVDIDSGSTTANDVINALNGNAQFAANFTAELESQSAGRNRARRRRSVGHRHHRRRQRNATRPVRLANRQRRPDLQHQLQRRFRPSAIC